MKEQVIISLTSWRKRIGNIPRVLDSIWEQTYQPDMVVLNLAEEEFPNKTLPAAVQAYIVSHQRLRVNWVEQNTRVWKKFLPTFNLYPDALIIPIDDDILYPPTMIEDFMRVHERFPDNPISGNKFWYKGVKCHCGCASLVQAKHFAGWQDYYSRTLRANCPSSDLFYTYHAAANGYFYEESDVDYMTTAITYNEVEGYSRSMPGNKLAVSRKAIFTAMGVEVIRLFTHDDIKPFCVLGAAQTEKGKEIEAELLSWLVPNFNVYVVRHDGRTFEYAAIHFLQEVMTRCDAPCFYLHTKGAYYTRNVSHRVRNMWKHEFVEKRDEYLRAVLSEKAIVATPYTGTDKVTWYNGWCANAAAIRKMNIIKTDDRFYYEYKLFDNAEVIGMRMGDVNGDNRDAMHNELKEKFD